jgi:hypothetical protein
MAKKQSDRPLLLVATLAGGTRKNTVRVLGVLGVLLIVGGLIPVIASGGEGDGLSPDGYNPFETGLKWLGAGLFIWFVAAGFNRDWLRGESAGP